MGSHSRLHIYSYVVHKCHRKPSSDISYTSTQTSILKPFEAIIGGHSLLSVRKTVTVCCKILVALSVIMNLGCRALSGLD